MTRSLIQLPRDVAAGAAGLASVSVWALALVAAFVVGVGFGVLVVAVNGLFAEGFGERGAAMLNLLGASFGAGALLLAAAGLALAHSPGLSPVASTLTGLALGPVFPTTLAWLAAAAPGARASTALVFAAAQLGGVVLPALIGRMIDAGSPAVIPTTLAGVALACLGMTLLLHRSEAAALR